MSGGLKLLPGHRAIQLGSTPSDTSGVMKALKKAAPLAIGDWKIYVEPAENCFQYGIFHGDLSPISIEVEKILLSGDTKSVRVVRLHQTAADCVEINSFLGASYNIFLSHKKAEEPPPGTYLDDLVSTICTNVEESIQESVQTFLRRALRNALLYSHGTLIAVTSGKKRPRLLDDGVHLHPAIDLAELTRSVIDGVSNASELLPHISLLQGMINSDGIVVFNPYGALLSYNCFIVPKKQQPKRLSGGARRRAYDTLCSKIGRGLRAVYIQSHDGATEFSKGS